MLLTLSQIMVSCEVITLLISLIFFLLALHIAVQFNNLAVVKVLLAQCDVDVYALNSKYAFAIIIS